MSWQGFVRYKRLARTAWEEKPKEANFHKHRNPKQAWVVHEPKDIYTDFCHQKQSPKKGKWGSVERKSLSDVFSVPVVVGQQGGYHGHERDAHHTDHIDLEAESKAGKVLLGDQPFEPAEENTLYHQFAKGLKHDFWGEWKNNGRKLSFQWVFTYDLDIIGNCQ